MTGSLTSVHVVGGLLPTDILSAVLAGSLDGLKPGDYHLGGETPREASARVWTHLLGVYRRTGRTEEIRRQADWLRDYNEKLAARGK